MYGFVPSLEMLVKTLHSVVGNIIFKTLYPNVLGVTKNGLCRHFICRITVRNNSRRLPGWGPCFFAFFGILCPICGQLNRKTLEKSRVFQYGGDEEIRTLDLTDANRTLSQLSYAPIGIIIQHLCVVCNSFSKFCKNCSS